MWGHGHKRKHQILCERTKRTKTPHFLWMEGVHNFILMFISLRLDTTTFRSLFQLGMRLHYRSKESINSVQHNFVKTNYT